VQATEFSSSLFLKPRSFPTEFDFQKLWSDG
jgi:hypothetical protein